MQQEPAANPSPRRKHSRGAARQQPGFPRAPLFEAAIKSGSNLSPASLYRLAAQQIQLDGGQGFEFVEHQRTDLTLAAACFFIRALNHTRGESTVAALGHNTVISNALRGIEKTVVAWRQKTSMDADRLEPATALAPAILLNFARRHGFARQPTPSVRNYIVSNLSFGKTLTYMARAAREDGFIRSAFGMPPAGHGSTRHFKSEVCLDAPRAGADADAEPDQTLSEAFEDDDCDFVPELEARDDALAYVAKLLHIDPPKGAAFLPIIEALMPPSLLTDGVRGVLRALLSTNLLAQPGSESLLREYEESKALTSAIRSAKVAARAIITALDDGDDLAALPHLTKLESLLRMILWRTGQTGESDNLLDHTALLRELRGVYATHENAAHILPSFVAWRLL